jgi:hypothetical protein
MSKQREERPRGLLRQGDVLLVPVERLPKGAVPVKSSERRLVLAVGETTGHAHVVAGPHARLFAAGPWTSTSRRTRFLVVDGEPATLVHEEHDPVTVPPGNYRVVRQREYEPQPRRSWRTVGD